MHAKAEAVRVKVVLQFKQAQKAEAVDFVPGRAGRAPPESGFCTDLAEHLGTDAAGGHAGAKGQLWLLNQEPAELEVALHLFKLPSQTMLQMWEQTVALVAPNTTRSKLFQDAHLHLPEITHTGCQVRAAFSLPDFFLFKNS